MVIGGLLASAVGGVVIGLSVAAVASKAGLTFWAGLWVTVGLVVGVHLIAVSQVLAFSR